MARDVAALVLGLLVAVGASAETFRRRPEAAPGLAPFARGRWRLVSRRAGAVTVTFDRWDEVEGRRILVGHRQGSEGENALAALLEDGRVLVLVADWFHCERYVFPRLGRRRARGTLTMFREDCETPIPVRSLPVRARRR